MPKGFTSIIILLGIALVILIGGVVVYQKVLAPKAQLTSTPIITPTLAPSKVPTAPITLQKTSCADLQQLRKILIDDSPKNFIYLQLPQKASIIKPNNCEPIVGKQVDWHKVRVAIGNSEYDLGFTAGEGGSPLDSYQDQDLRSNLVLRGILRIWNKGQGTTLLNPQSLGFEGGDGLDHFVISKQSPDNLFTSEELAVWKDILLNNWVFEKK